MFNEEKLVMTWKECKERVERAYEQGYQAGYISGVEAASKITMEVFDRTLPAPIIVQKEEE